MTADTTKPATVRVRVLVAVDSDGDWTAAACDNNDVDDAMEWINTRRLRGNIDYHWITAEVPIPRETTIEGSVSDAEG